MSHYSLLCENYQWLDNPCNPYFPEIATVEENWTQGWFFETDDEIPVELHDSVKDFDILDLKRLVSKESLSSNNNSLLEDVGIHWTSSKQKLIAHRHPKQNIFVHCVLLQWILATGFRFTMIHRALQFGQGVFGLRSTELPKSFLFTVSSSA